MQTFLHFSSTSGQSTPEQKRMELRSYSCRQATQNEKGIAGTNQAKLTFFNESS